MRFWPLPRKTAPRAVYSRSKKAARQQVDSDNAMTGKLVRELTAQGKHVPALFARGKP